MTPMPRDVRDALLGFAALGLIALAYRVARLWG